ncbi:hypothetical protein SAY86_005807 [Trapa natans]|uniref:Transcription elongation factor Eaf N-terminal domain-containing protein n=1 Tax=Trapa natans TaxID=22666 RepID=A0AAN7L441_TRANT|nr:hypothetical protein SAY86_005807 [Trapa natans]
MVKEGHGDEDPCVAPKPDVWYDLKLGSSFRDRHPSSKFCPLGYEFKPTSMDKNRPGYFHKRKKDTMVHMEFQNNQQGKPNVVFQGIVEDYKENGAILLFDGHTFRMEQLHHAVNKLRHVWGVTYCISGTISSITS